MDITITRFQPCVRPNPKGSVLLGFLDVRLAAGGANIEIRDMRMRRTTDGRLSIGSPTRDYKTREGEDRSRSMVRLDAHTYERLLHAAAALDAVQAVWREGEAAAALKPAASQIPF